jgi:drug/metabolite transporter (DMT)-like permease
MDSSPSSLKSAAALSKWGVPLALFALYFIWGSTYLAIRFAVETLPPLLMAGIRFTVAGGLLYGYLIWRGTPAPTREQWWGAARIGVLLVFGGNGFITLAEARGVSSGLAATLVAIMPLGAAFWSGLFGKWPRALEWTGLVLGLVGVVLLTRDGSLQGNPLGLVFALAAPLCWSFGTVWSKHLTMPGGIMSSAAQMLTGSVALGVVGLLSGERLTSMPSSQSLWALLYLIFFGSIVAFSAYLYLVARVAPTLATSYAYVNPAVALILGAWLGNEVISNSAWMAIPIILGAVGLVVWSQNRN